MPQYSDKMIERLVEQVGPGSAAERGALRRFLEGQFFGDSKFSWTGVAILLVGVVAGYIGNMLSVAAG